MFSKGRRASNLVLSVLLLSSTAGCMQRSYNAAEVKDSRNPEVNHSAYTESKALAGIIKGKISDASPEEVLRNLKRQYVKLHLMDRSGKWRLPEFERISSRMIPADLNINLIFSFIDEIAINMEDNPYMMRFLQEAMKQTFPILKQKFNTEGRAVMLEAVTAAFAFEAITAAEIADPKLIGVLTRFWPEERKAAGVSMQQTGIFGIVKLLSVEDPVKHIAEFHGGKPLDPKFLRGFLSLNIDEAVIADMVTKHYDNAKAGWPLAIHQAGGEYNAKLGTGPATFSPDRLKIEIRYALPKQWDDLYQVWNMAFVSQIPTYPLWISKLLIPAMSSYKKYPEQYIYRRALSLYTALHYYNLSLIEDQKDGIASVNWVDDSMTQLWGRINKESAEDYTRQVERDR